MQKILAPLGFQQITGTAGVPTGLTVPNGSMIALIQVEGQEVRYRDDGTNPTTTVGINLMVGDMLEYTGDLTTIKFIEKVTGAILNISYYA